jgi:hypothetical protein
VYKLLDSKGPLDVFLLFIIYCCLYGLRKGKVVNIINQFIIPVSEIEKQA